MTTLPDFNALVRVMDLLHTPYVAEVLDCLQRSVQPIDALPDADVALVDGAVERLMALTAICEVTLARTDISSARPNESAREKLLLLEGVR